MKDDRSQDSDKFQLSLYLMPFLGAILAGVKLGTKSSLDSQEKKISRLSLRLGLIWLVIYSALWFGGNVTSDILAIRFLYLNTIVTTTYFIACFILLRRLWRK